MYRVLILRLVAGLAAGIFAYKKGRSIYIWALSGFIFPPAVLILFFLPPRLAKGVTSQCPYCSRVNYRKDTVCRHCRRELPIDLVRCRECGSFVPEKEYCMQCNKRLKD